MGLNEGKNLDGEKLKVCSRNPMTGFYRDGYCRTGKNDIGSHTVCAEVTEEFLEFTKSKGNNLDMLKPGDKWCLCAKRWKEANEEGIAPKIIRQSTNIKTLNIIDIVNSELDEYARTLKNARQQGVGLRFSKSAIKSSPQRFRPYNRKGINESDPKTGTGEKPKGSGRRLYTDENPSDTVSVKFRTKEDIIDTLNKDSFKSKPHKRQSQIINLIHQRVRAAYQNTKESETKQRLKRAFDYIETVKEKSKEKTIRLQKEGFHNLQEERKRIHFNFKELYAKGIVFITQCHDLRTGEKCEGSNLITLYNVKYPVKGQEFISKALEHPKPEDIEFWQKHQDQLTQDKYEQILKSIVMFEKSNLF